MSKKISDTNDDNYDIPETITTDIKFRSKLVYDEDTLQASHPRDKHCKKCGGITVMYDGHAKYESVGDTHVDVSSAMEGKIIVCLTCSRKRWIIA